MIPRYTRPEMGNLWTLETKYDLWLRVSLAILRIKEANKLAPRGTYELIKENASFSVERITMLDEGPQGFNHDLHAFVETVKESLREKEVPARIIVQLHKDVTSYDVEDSAFSIQIALAVEEILRVLSLARATLYRRALEYKETPMMGLTHGQAAEIITLGLKLLNFVAMLDRDKERLECALHNIRFGRLAGAVGNHGHLSPEIEKQVCQELQLKPALISTQIIHRDAHAALFGVLAVMAVNIQHIAQNLWAMCQFPRMEAREGFRKGQRGSSQMPHKRNPITLERLMGMPSLIRGYNLALQEMIVSRDERIIDQSSVERVAWPDGTILVHYMLYQLERVAGGMDFFPGDMMKNIDKTLGLTFSGFVKDLLLGKGKTKMKYKEEYQPTYQFVQSCAFEAWDRQVHLMLVLRQRNILKFVSRKELVDCFDTLRATKYVDEQFAKFA